MNEELCLEKHKRLEEKLETHEKRLNAHGEKLDSLEQDNASFKAELRSLCDNLKALTSVMKWFIGIWVTTLLGFFIYSIEKLI
ncbi:hemolysin XhlA family protein [Clostridium beijerinckii]|uniref:Chromosome segregation ATPase n=1 Tax=Clostridium beijerinckii TaxID=1520 RepID=A0AAX0B648_CLOBE|nr:hemolysin XhlA family protein [Clostridium beijerinckii]NRT90078.1 chromosome segregation ATPase [Clostridium beijerinckii]NYC69608.1 chromosome segregation ATPase [Clostridium beijerinckii]